MTPIINVEWEHHRQNRVSIDLLTSRVQQLSNSVQLNQVVINEIKQQLADGIQATGGGGGFPMYGDSQYFKFALPPNTPTKVVNALAEPQLRQLLFKSSGGTTFLEYGGRDNLLFSPVEIPHNFVFCDDYDNGDEVWALAPLGATIYIQVRLADASNSGGSDFVIPLKTEIILGNHVLDLVSFHPGQKYTFAIEPSPTMADWLVVENDFYSPTSPYNRYKDKCIEVYAPNFYDTVPAFLRDFITSGGYGMDSDKTIGGTIKRGGWLASFGRDGGVFEFYPDYSHRHLLFNARVSDYHTKSSGNQDVGSGVAEPAKISFDKVLSKITLTEK